MRLRSPLFSPVLLCVALATTLAGCASTPSEGVVSKALEWVGLKTPEPSAESIKAALPATSRKVSLRLHAGEQLNTDKEKRALSVVVRVYKLRSANAFLAAPYQTFGSSETEKTAFGNDLLDMRELVLTPGQKHEVVETLPLDASHLAVVTLFRAPADGRWRFAFGAKEAEVSGVTLGLHGCAMNVALGVPEGAPPETLRLAGVNCL